MGILRTLLALSVVCGHTPLTYIFVGGQNAVQAFYMISGFLISFVLHNTPAYANRRTFWRNRALRLFPVYFVVLVLSLVAHLFNPQFWADFAAMPWIAKLLGSVANLTIVGQDWLLFGGIRNGEVVFSEALSSTALPLHKMLVVPPSWTLGIELTFYLIAPFLVGRTLLVAILLILSLGARLLAFQIGFGGEDPWTYRFFPFELALFLVGVIAHKVMAQFFPNAPTLPGYRNAVLVSVAAWFLCLFFPFIPLTDGIKTLLFLSVIALALPSLFIFQAQNKIDKWIGDLSYPLYVGHYLVIMAFGFITKTTGFMLSHQTVRWTAAVLLSVLFACALQILVANPIERLRKQVRAQ